MVGDSVDNVPGVPQIGPKAAQQLLSEFGSLENIYENLDRVAGAKRQETLREHREQAFISQRLTRLSRDVPIEYDWSNWRHRNPNAEEIQAMFQELGFRRLAERFALAETNSTAESKKPLIDRTKYVCVVPNDFDPGKSASRAMTALSEKPLYQSWDEFESEVLEHLSRLPPEERFLAIDSETTSLAARDAKPVGYSIAWGIGQAAYLPILGPEPERLLDRDRVKAFLSRSLRTRQFSRSARI